ncbi:hypothetical protein HPB47_022000 [Ixodes persulcatus]|uniref:Uncharacterized protein n=1 Tax=Ixodes persulcatus TaxID=34615 RepID=A0AC60QBY3_IXOPE|nr:hypothetical protein HPB47_022000 [Ixodes persulcatus]
MSSEQGLSQRSKWRCGVTGALLLGLPLSLLGLASTLQGRRSTWTAPGLCTTAACRTTALALNVSLSHSVAPCQDLNRFVCEGWPHLEHAGSRVQLIMNYAWTTYNVPRRAQSGIDKVVAVYQSCVASLSPGGGDMTTLRSFLVHLGLGPSGAAPGAALRALLTLSLAHSVNLLLDVSVNGTGFSVLPVAPPEGPVNQTSYAVYVKRIAELALLDEPEAVLHDVLALRKELDASPSPSNEPWHTVALASLAQETGSLVDWLHRLPHASPDSLVFIGGLSRVRAHAAFLRRHRGDHALRRYVAWHTAQVLGSLSHYEIFRMTLENAIGQLEPTPGLIKATCLAHAANLMPHAYNAFVVRHFATPRSRKALEVMGESLRAAATTGIRSSDWMTDKPKAMTTLKLKKLSWLLPRKRSETQVNRAYAHLPDLGVSNFLNAYLSVTQHNGKVDTQEANQAAVDVVYSPLDNTVVVSAGMLNTPFFEDTLPAAFNYAGLGHRMALELLHAVDEHGRWYDQRGHRRDWWDSVTEQAYQQHVKCFADGERALLESSALRLAYQAFRRMHENVVLKGLEHFTPDQMFFISSCHKWCGQSASPCNVAVRNLQEFSHTFNCQSEDAMNPSTRCALLT